jgi:hypothetical protein
VPPTKAPALVPAMQLMGIFKRSIISNTPKWAKPRAPPPPKTKPIRGADSAVATVAAAHNIKQNTVTLYDDNRYKKRVVFCMIFNKR